MANTTDSSGGKSPDTGKPGVDTQKDAARKPSAVIDLKPTGVDIRDPKKDASKAAATVAAAAEKAAGASPATAGSTAPGGGPGTATQGTAAQGAGTQGSGTQGAGAVSKPQNTSGASNPATPAAASAKAGASAGPATDAGPSGSASRPAPPSSGIRGAATHLVAGLAGGLLALLGSEFYLPKAHDAGGDLGKVTQAFDKRVRELEAAAAKPASTDASQRLAAAEKRLAEFERAAKAIEEQQAKLAGQTQALGQRFAEAPAASGGAEERLAKLESILTTLSAAAADDQQRGRIPQLATLTGKLADLEASLATQVAQLRKSVTQEVDSRLSQSSEAAQAARTGTQRLDRELAGVKTEAAQTTNRLDGIKAQSDRLDLSVKGVREETAALKTDVAAVRDDVARELKQVARPTDVNAAVSPVVSKLAALEQNVQGVVRGEDDRRANVERIVMALELGNLKRTVERGVAFGPELAEVRRVAGPKLDLGVLDKYKDRGVPSIAELEREFRTIAFSIIDAERQPEGGNWTDRLIASAKSVVRVRKVETGAEESGIEAQVSRMEQDLKSGRLADVVAEAGKLSDKARAPARGWLEKVEARASVDRAISSIEQDLKASLGAASQSGKKD